MLNRLMNYLGFSNENVNNDISSDSCNYSIQSHQDKLDFDIDLDLIDDHVNKQNKLENKMNYKFIYKTNHYTDHKKELQKLIKEIEKTVNKDKTIKGKKKNYERKKCLEIISNICQKEKNTSKVKKPKKKVVSEKSKKVKKLDIQKICNSSLTIKWENKKKTQKSEGSL